MPDSASLTMMRKGQCRIRLPIPFFTLSLLQIVLALAEAGETASAQQSWSWNPEDEHQCTIPRIPLDLLQNKFPPNGLVPPLFPTPFILVAGNSSSQRNRELRKRTSVDHILDQFPDNSNIALSSSNAKSEHRRETTLKQYLNETLSAGVTTPEHSSNENWYLFGHTYGPEWQLLTRQYELPPCRTCRPDLCALSFGIGNRGSGVQWHVHGPGFSEALHGRKHWILYPRLHKPAKYHRDQSSRQWMEYVYPHSNPKPHECTCTCLSAILSALQSRLVC
jgi:hypothetical protein